jgi:transposase InsO family protein
MHKKADEVSNAIELVWLTRYPWPQEITYDAGSEFKAEFQTLILEEYRIKAKPITVRNPQANAIIERVHGVIGDMIRTHDMSTINETEANPFEGFISAICWAIRSTYHTTLKATPGQLVFGRDMIFNISHEADWQLIHERKRARIEDNNARENVKRRELDHNGRLQQDGTFQRGSVHYYTRARKWYSDDPKGPGTSANKHKTMYALCRGTSLGSTLLQFGRRVQ